MLRKIHLELTHLQSKELIELRLCILKIDSIVSTCFWFMHKENKPLSELIYKVSLTLTNLHRLQTLFNWKYVH